MKNLINRLLAFVFALLWIAGVFAVPWISACSSLKTAWAPANRSATIAKLEAAAEAALGTAAVAALQGAASSNGDYAYSAAQAVWASGAIGDIQQGVVDAGGSPQLAVMAEDLARKAAAGKAVKTDAINAVASAIESGILKTAAAQVKP